MNNFFIALTYIMLGTPVLFGQSTTRLNTTNAIPVPMDTNARIIWISPTDPNFLFKASPLPSSLYTKSEANDTFMKKSAAADSIQAMKTTINGNMTWTQSKFNDYYTKTQSDTRYLQSAPVSSINGQTGAVTLTIPTNTNQLTNGSGFITGINSSMVTTALGFTPLQVEVDGSVTNEIELPSQSGQSGKFLTTNGSTPSWGTPAASTYDSLQVYNASGRVNRRIKVWEDIITPTTAQGHTVDISSAGFSTITNIQLQPGRNTNLVEEVPLVSVKTYSTTSLSMNIVSANKGLVAVLIGLLFPTSVSGVTVHVRVTGY